jgi:hypothetical protein
MRWPDLPKPIDSRNLLTSLALRHCSDRGHGLCLIEAPFYEIEASELPGGASMKRTSILDRLVAAGGNALFGGMCGALLASFGNVIGGSVLGSGTHIALLILVGGYVGRLPGAILGGMSAILIAAFGSLVGGSVLGAVLTVVVCSFISGWISWANSGDFRGLIDSFC